MKPRRLVVGVVGVAVVLVAAHGVVARFAACPIRKPTVAELEAQRVMAMRGLAAEATAAAPSLALDGLILGSTTREELVARLGAGATCTPELGGASVTCSGGRTETVARFDPGGRLVGLDRSEERSSSAEAARELRARLDARAGLGSPERRWGETTADFLDAPLRQAGASWRFRDLAVDLTATHLAGGVVVREQQRLLVPGKS